VMPRVNAAIENSAAVNKPAASSPKSALQTAD
jgi:hypothetical protein